MKRITGLLILGLFTLGVMAQTNSELLELKLQLVDAKLRLLDEKLGDNTETEDRIKEQTYTADSLIRELEKKNRQYTIDTSAPKQIKWVIGMDPARLFEGTMMISVERVFGKTFSLQGSVLGTYVSRNGFGGGYLNSMTLESYDSRTNSYFPYSSDQLSGFGFALEVKNYLGSGSKAPFGIYASAQVLYRHIVIEGTWPYYCNDYYDDYCWPSDNFKQKLNMIRTGFFLGYKFTIGNVVSLDLFAGGVFRLSGYENEPHLTKLKNWKSIDYTGVLPSAGITIGILK